MATTNSIDPIPSVILQGHYQFNEFFGVSTPSNISIGSTAGTLNLSSSGNVLINASGAGNGINLNANIFTNFNAPLVQFTNATGTLYSAVGVINMTAQNNSSIVSLGGDFVFGANGVLTFNSPIFTLPQLASASTANVLYYDTVSKHVSYGAAPGGGGNWNLTGTNVGLGLVFGTNSAHGWSYRVDGNVFATVDSIGTTVYTGEFSVSGEFNVNTIPGIEMITGAQFILTAVNDITLNTALGDINLASPNVKLPNISNTTTANVLYYDSTTFDISYGAPGGGGGIAGSGTVGRYSRFITNTTTIGDGSLSENTNEVASSKAIAFGSAASDSASVLAGSVFYRSDLSALRLYNGASWVTIEAGNVINPGTANTLAKYNGAGTNLENSLLTQPVSTRIESSGLIRLMNFGGDFSDKAEGGIYYDTSFAQVKYYKNANIRRTVVSADGSLASSTGQFAIFDSISWSITSSPSMIDFGSVVRFDVPFIAYNSTNNPVISTFGTTYYNSTVHKLRYFEGGGGGWNELPTAAIGTNGGLETVGITTVQRDALTPQAGWIIYNTTVSKHQGYNGSWNDLY